MNLSQLRSLNENDPTDLLEDRLGGLRPSRRQRDEWERRWAARPDAHLRRFEEKVFAYPDGTLFELRPSKALREANEKRKLQGVRATVIIMDDPVQEQNAAWAKAWARMEAIIPTKCLFSERSKK